MSNGNSELRIIVVGSRTFNDYNFLADKLNAIISEYDGFEHQQIKFISGMERGADALGKRYANDNKYEVVHFPAHWGAHGKNAGYRRDGVMTEYAASGACGVLVAFWNGESGTEYMTDLARNYGLKFYIYDCQIEGNTKYVEYKIDVGKKMRNIDAIRQMSLEEIAPYFVTDATIEIDDPYYSSPSGKKFWTEEDAIEDCIEWLNSEYK